MPSCALLFYFEHILPLLNIVLFTFLCTVNREVSQVLISCSLWTLPVQSHYHSIYLYSDNCSQNYLDFVQWQFCFLNLHTHMYFYIYFSYNKDLKLCVPSLSIM